MIFGQKLLEQTIKMKTKWVMWFYHIGRKKENKQWEKMFLFSKVLVRDEIWWCIKNSPVWREVGNHYAEV